MTQRTQHDVAAVGDQATEGRFKVYGAYKLRNVIWFKYLGRVILQDDNNIPAMHRNLKRAQVTC